MYQLAHGEDVELDIISGLTEMAAISELFDDLIQEAEFMEDLTGTVEIIEEG